MKTIKKTPAYIRCSPEKLTLINKSQMARKLGITAGYLHDILKGRYAPPKQVEKINSYLDKMFNAA